MRLFPRQACRFTVKDMIWWMDELGCGNDTAIVPCVKRDVPIRIWELAATNIAMLPAQDIPAKWIGGARVIKHYEGHLMQLLMDRVLTEIKTNGMGKFLQTNKKFKEEKAKQKQRQMLGSATTSLSSINVYDPWAQKHQNIYFHDVAGTAGYAGTSPFDELTNQTLFK